FIRNAMRHGNGQLPPGAPQFTKALTTLRTLRSMLATSLRSYENCMHDPKALAALDFQTLITLTKVEASELAAATVMSAMRACGLAGYRNDGDYTIGRYLRDVLSSPIMINNDRILANLAPSALVSPIPRFLRECAPPTRSPCTRVRHGLTRAPRRPIRFPAWRRRSSWGSGSTVSTPAR